MTIKKVVILDGTRYDDTDLTRALDVLTAVMELNAAEVRTFTLRNLNLGRCIGCFGCWLETPGICCDAVSGAAQAVIDSDIAVLFSPVTFGGYSSELKRMVDRFIQFALPYFCRYQGETHHLPRYSRFPKLVAVGVQRHSNPDEAKVFKGIVGRNAINFHAPSHAAEVVLSTDDSATLRRLLQPLVERVDPLPLGRALRSFVPVPSTPGADAAPGSTRRALIVVGSPKINTRSASNVLAGRLLNRLRESGWETETLTLKANLGQEAGQAELCSSVDLADLLVLVFPLYIDALPFLMTKVLEVVAAHRQGTPAGRRQRLAVVCNSGFPESDQSAVASAICHQFAAQTGMIWAGSLAIGGGGALGGQSLTANNYPGVRHVIRALDLTASALSEGQPIPQEAVAATMRSPIPFIPFTAWCWLYGRVGGKGMQRQAIENGVSKYDLLARPLAA
jgi:multimeric flavodoxin WrbA